jgi:isocitrate dehydrogenase
MQRITITRGDGIGPEIMEACLDILKKAGALLHIDEIEAGKKVYLAGNPTGIDPHAWHTITHNKIFLKAPITTPQGGGYKSLNVTTRKLLGLFANIRPCKSLHPYIEARHPLTNMVIIRENEEDLYAGIEYQQTDEVIQSLKLISKPGCEKIIRYAFEYARFNGRKKVTCLTKDNIMKQTDGLFHQIFDQIGQEYPEILKEHLIIDIGAALIADTPEKFDVIVTLNLYGDIISDIAAQITGSVGMAGSANIGEKYAMFEAIHGSAPDIAGKGIANPSGLLQACVMMLEHIGQAEIAHKIQNAWLVTLEQGIHTSDIYREEISKQRVSTEEFAKAIIQNFGRKPEILQSPALGKSGIITIPPYKKAPKSHKELVGVDLYIHWNDGLADELAAILTSIFLKNLKLELITNRGLKVWPESFQEAFCTDHWRCRFLAIDSPVEKQDIIDLLALTIKHEIDVIKTENLYYFDGKPAFSTEQG